MNHIFQTSVLIMECIELNWLSKHKKKIRSSQPAIPVLNWIKHQSFPVSIVKRRKCRALKKHAKLGPTYATFSSRVFLFLILCANFTVCDFFGNISFLLDFSQSEPLKIYKTERYLLLVVLHDTLHGLIRIFDKEPLWISMQLSPFEKGEGFSVKRTSKVIGAIS